MFIKTEQNILQLFVLWNSVERTTFDLFVPPPSPSFTLSSRVEDFLNLTAVS